jgi:hypothetical protein
VAFTRSEGAIFAALRVASTPEKRVKLKLHEAIL